MTSFKDMPNEGYGIERITPAAGWQQTELAQETLAGLRKISRDLVAANTHTCVFSGASGTGKTLAAQVLASELRLDLWRIDLSARMDKYIGETEKNLDRLFDTAENRKAILFFDEADALFGKRSEVRDSHGRFANLDTSHLLQRIMDYPGVAIVGVDNKEALAGAVARRFQIVDFPATCSSSDSKRR